MKPFQKPIFLKLFILFFLATSPLYAQSEKLLFAIDVIRHGDRTPVSNPPSIPYLWPQDIGKLTPKGMQQEYDLGKTLRQRYVKTFHLLPASYDSEAMHVRSTDFDRTLMSAQSLLLGLYPLGTGPITLSKTPALPRAFQPIPIHTTPQELDTLLLPDHNPKAHKAVLEKYVFNLPVWQQKTAELSPQFKRWSELLGIKISSIQQLSKIADRLHIQQLYHFPLPAKLTKEDANVLIDAGRWVFVTTFKQPQVAQMIGKNLLTTILEYLKAAQENKSKLKYVLFSAHDSTLMSLMTMLGAPLDTQPPYASDLNFSLYEADNKLSVKITYNNQMVSIPVCGGTDCKIEDLEKLVADKD
jgi:lysosomal acid phosphatase